MQNFYAGVVFEHKKIKTLNYDKESVVLLGETQENLQHNVPCIVLGLNY